jgi:hypothetical protein
MTAPTFGGTTLPGTVLSVMKLKPRIKVEIPIPGREYPFKKDKGGMGMKFVITGVSTSKHTDAETLLGWADGTARSLDVKDGTDAVTCIMFDPKIEVNQRNVTEMLYTLTFEQSA